MSINPSHSEIKRKDQFHQAYLAGLDEAKVLCESLIYEIETFWGEGSISATSDHTCSFANPTTKKIFVVHGRDEGTKDSMTQFLENLGLDPIVLQEQPDKGQTVIEKFEGYAGKSSFATVLCTPDDVGTLDSGDEPLKKRARQNVIFELGFFVGKLGRHRVSLIVKGDVEIPSDFAGVLYTEIDDSGVWKKKIARELKAAGFAIDENQALDY